MKKIYKGIIVLLLAVFFASPLSAQTNININEATTTELAAALVGVGQAKAQAIVDYREVNGRFVSVEELLEVSGIGTVILEKNREVVSLGIDVTN